MSDVSQAAPEAAPSVAESQPENPSATAPVALGAAASDVEAEVLDKVMELLDKLRVGKTGQAIETVVGWLKGHALIP